MAMAIAVPVSERQGRGIAGMDVHSVADGLTAAGLDVRIPALEESCYLKITNVRGAFCEVVIDEDGCATWEYRPFSGSATDPALITSVITDILGAGAAECRGAALGRFPGVTLKGVAGRALRERGMRVELNIVGLDDSWCEVYAEIVVADPGQPARGIVRLDDDGVIRWECRLVGPAAAAQGIGAGEFTATMARILAGNRKQQPAS